MQCFKMYHLRLILNKSIVRQRDMEMTVTEEGAFPYNSLQAGYSFPHREAPGLVRRQLGVREGMGEDFIVVFIERNG